MIKVKQLYWAGAYYEMEKELNEWRKNNPRAKILGISSEYIVYEVPDKERH